MSTPYALIQELKPYITSGNDVPVTRATLPASLIERILNELENGWIDGYEEGRNDGYESGLDEGRRDQE